MQTAMRVRFDLMTLLLVVFAASCTETPPESRQGPTPGATSSSTDLADQAPPEGRRLAEYSDPLVRFTYPSTWRPYRYRAETSFSSHVVTLSSQELKESSDIEPGTVMDCDPICLPDGTLDLDGVVVTWTSWGPPQGLDLSKVEGSATELGGHEAKVATDRPGTCGAGAEETITAHIQRLGHEYYVVRACLRGPNLDDPARQVEDMLRSIEFLTP
jgi:hypothetical protein